ncbi:MAG: endolytic transglycosylase MltG [Patescibacteria group bacterium]
MNLQYQLQPEKTSILKVVLYCVLAFVLLVTASLVYVYFAFNSPAYPDTLPMVIDIEKGSSLQEVTEMLGDKGVIRSPFLFRSSMILGGLESSIKTGEYTFNKPIIMAEVVERLVKGKYEYVPVRLIIREGENAQSVADAMAVQFPKLATTTVMTELKKREGKLFPETYLFAPFTTVEEIFTTIDAEYEKRITPFREMIAASGRTELQILTIASILENEVPVKEDMKVVAGIIYNRLRTGMPLQMDSTLGYFTGKASLELTSEDLKLDSPYNTYVYKGLPPGPIGNPGEVSIEAALRPASHSYIFFLSDATGVNHYAKTYAEHLANRKKYLGK